MAKRAQHFSSLDSTAANMYRMTAEDVDRLHEVLLEMYLDIEKVCRKHKIHLIAAGGSALGAIRHKGFIPWDDDLDLFIFRKEFERLRRIFDEELGDRYVLLAPGNKAGANCFLPRFVKKGTTLLGMIDESSPYPAGIYIDINIIEYAPENPLLFAAKSLLCDGLRVISYSVYWAQYPSSSFRQFMMNSKGKRYYQLRMLMGRVCSFMRAETWFALFDRAVRSGRSDVYTVPSGTKKYRGEKLLRETIFPLKRVPFESSEIYVFHDYDGYLSNLYGDYMKIPDVKHREYHLCLKLDFEHEISK